MHRHFSRLLIKNIKLYLTTWCWINNSALDIVTRFQIHVTTAKCWYRSEKSLPKLVIEKHIYTLYIALFYTPCTKIFNFILAFFYSTVSYANPMKWIHWVGPKRWIVHFWHEYFGESRINIFWYIYLAQSYLNMFQLLELTRIHQYRKSTMLLYIVMWWQ